MIVMVMLMTMVMEKIISKKGIRKTRTIRSSAEGGSKEGVGAGVTGTCALPGLIIPLSHNESFHLSNMISRLNCHVRSLLFCHECSWSCAVACHLRLSKRAGSGGLPLLPCSYYSHFMRD